MGRHDGTKGVNSVTVNWGKFSKTRSSRFLSVSLCLQRYGYSFPSGTGEFDDLLQVRVRESFQHMPFLKFLQLEIFSMPRYPILGQRVLNPVILQ